MNSSLTLKIITIVIATTVWLAAYSEGIDVGKNLIRLSLSGDPPSLDSSLTEDVDSHMVISHLQEGLVRLGRRGEIEPGVALRWEVEDRQITFWLRDDAKWSDGKAVTAEDFAFAWRRLVNPRTAAGGSTSHTYIFENATEILRGEKSLEALGVEVINPHTLKVKLSVQAPYALNLFTGPPYVPLRQDFVMAQNGQYAADTENLLANGPFMLAGWKHGASMKLVKNPYYWNRENVKLTTVEFAYMTADQRALYNLFDGGELADVRIYTDTLEEAMDAGHRIYKTSGNCSTWLGMSFEARKPTSNIHLRRAIRQAIDRDAYVSNIIGLPGSIKLESIFPAATRGVESSFQHEFPAKKISYDLEQARISLRRAREDFGGRIPPLVLLTYEVSSRRSEFIQSQLINNLGIDVRVDTQSLKQYVAKIMQGDYDIAGAGFCWGALTDPIAWAGLFAADSSWNTFGYDNAEYNRLEKLTHHTDDPVERMKIFGQLQNILFDDSVIVPLSETSRVYLQDRRLKRVLRFPVLDYSTGIIGN
jgi:oligopeptide transport system substrate-binding protein